MSLLSSALTMLQAKLFIICNQALIQTGTRVDGSNPLKAEAATAASISANTA